MYKKHSVSYQKFSVKPFSKGLQVKGVALPPTGVGEIYFTECAPQEVNFKIVRWTVLKEGKPCKRGLP